MKKEYTKAEVIINRARLDLMSLLNDAGNNKTIEDQEAYATLDSVIDKMASAEDEFKYLNSPTKEGILQEDQERGKYYIVYDEGTESCNLSCGSPLEVYLYDDWIIGRVEARDGVGASSGRDYYFYGGDRPLLFTGMKVRTREL